MRTGRPASATLLLVGIAAISMSGCFRREFPERRQYILSTERVGPARDMSPVVIKVSRVRAEPQYERKAFVYRTGDATYSDDFYNTFYITPGQMIRSTLQKWVFDSGMFANVVDVDSLVGANWVLEPRLVDFYIDKRGPESDTAVVRMAMTLVESTASPPRAILEREYEEAEPASGRRGENYVAAWGGALAKVYGKLEADLAEVLSQRRGR